ncbi:alpha/beta hydrolase [Maritimibacter sp. UBA3975]|uniref:alpha/beta fold hydrolase n=1 Tax=Maritimibacter sp. UBA3975 TaxID=1946833 RepID=UPI000C0B08A3|nr:alpha/beta hydrolase [Maritimibacter sp. UBA3975]MAM60475.1 epoxide hydrolase [Maritimibacter sp.]|tara:strand:+ start:11019 stop:11981 length:963 start_codon:yes stop_codon:yes gene_type:complete
MTDTTYIETNGIKLRTWTEGEGPLVILVHGFPETAHSWRHQMKPLVEAGYRVCIPDVRGYGNSDAPREVEAYTMEVMTRDFAGLAETLSDEPAIIIGHDWGAPLAWNTARLFPDRFRAVAGLSVPYAPPGDVPTIDLYHKLFTDKGRFFYQVYFQDVGVAEAELEADVEDSLAKFYYAWSGDCPPNGWPTDKAHGEPVLTGLPRPDLPLAWLTQSDLDAYAEGFRTSGFRGPLNRYRTSRQDHAFLKAHPSDPVIRQPSLFIYGDRDPVLTMFRGDPAELLNRTLGDLRGVHKLPGVGHWTQQEAPEAVNRHLIDWLSTL